MIETTRDGTKKSVEQCCDGRTRRVKYFRGMLLNQEEFELEQQYHMERRAQLNRLLHGWGILCGLEIELSDTRRCHVVIKSGAALDCDGRLIDVYREEELDLRQLCEEDECGVDVGTKTVCIVLKYHEKLALPQPIHSGVGGCERTCEYSRVSEGYCIELRDECEPPPCCCERPNTPKTCEETCRCLEELCHPKLNCPDCCTCEDVIVLGKVTIDCLSKRVYYVDQDVETEEGTVGGKASRAYRRYVWTAARMQKLHNILCQRFCVAESQETEPDEKDDSETSVVEHVTAKQGPPPAQKRTGRVKGVACGATDAGACEVEDAEQGRTDQ